MAATPRSLRHGFALWTVIGAWRVVVSPDQARRAGVATAATDALNNVEAPTREELASLLQTMIAALEASPVPRFEWAGLGRIFDMDQLASLLNVSVSSLKR